MDQMKKMKQTLSEIADGLKGDPPNEFEVPGGTIKVKAKPKFGINDGTPTLKKLKLDVRYDGNVEDVEIYARVKGEVVSVFNGKPDLEAEVSFTKKF